MLSAGVRPTQYDPQHCLCAYMRSLSYSQPCPAEQLSTQHGSSSRRHLHISECSELKWQSKRALQFYSAHTVTAYTSSVSIIQTDIWNAHVAFKLSDWHWTTTCLLLTYTTYSVMRQTNKTCWCFPKTTVVSVKLFAHGRTQSQTCPQIKISRAKTQLSAYVQCAADTMI